MFTNKRFRTLLAVLMIMTIAAAFTACTSDDDEWESSAKKGKNMKEAEHNLANFEAKTMSGKTVNQDIFKDYDLTIVNVWETSCGYCVAEMPGLQLLSEQVPENVQFITICMDAEEEEGLASRILKNSGATFETIIGNKQLDKKLLDQVSVAPTTYFVDSEGLIVGEPHVGAYDTDDYQEIADKYKDEMSVHLLQI